MKREMSEVQRLESGILKERRKVLWRPFMNAVRRYALIQPGDRIAVCVSGGKDSMLLAKLMQILERHSEVPFEAVYLVMDPGYDAANRRQVEDNARRLGIPYTLFESDVFEVAESQDANPCFLCARMRRGCLYDRAQALGCNKLALGHHFNDVIETTVMAMLWGGQLQGMMPKLRSRSHPGMEVIRPLYMVHEQDIIAWAEANGLSFIQCACRVTQKSGGSKRQEVKELLARLNLENDKVEKNVFNAIHTLQPDSFPGWRAHGVAHSFLEWYDGEDRT